MTKHDYKCSVSYNKKIGKCFYKIGLSFSGEGAKSFAPTEPGQFAEIDLTESTLPELGDIPKNLRDSARRSIILRRPFSFSDICVKSGETTVEILYCTVGPASLRMSNLKEGDRLSVIGPLGKGFWVPENKTTALLVLGGMGAGPLVHMAKHLREIRPDISITAFVGAKSIDDLPFENIQRDITEDAGDYLPEFSKSNVKTYIATDDGSAGFGGFVTDRLFGRLGELLLSCQETVIYACGPEAMLASVAQIAEAKNIDCQVSMERRMACGIGLCQGCAIECKVSDSRQTTYKMCCQDGPVFDSSEVVF